VIVLNQGGAVSAPSSLLYTGTIGAGALSPIIYGLFGNALGVFVMMGLIAAVCW
jgi:hypothetical protein